MIKDPEPYEVNNQPNLTDYLNMKNDTDIALFCSKVFSLIHDGYTYRQDQAQQESISAKLNITNKQLSMALQFIKKKGLADEFNLYLYERDV